MVAGKKPYKTHKITLFISREKNCTRKISNLFILRGRILRDECTLIELEKSQCKRYQKNKTRSYTSRVSRESENIDMRFRLTTANTVVSRDPQPYIERYSFRVVTIRQL